MMVNVVVRQQRMEAKGQYVIQRHAAGAARRRCHQPKGHRQQPRRERNGCAHDSTIRLEPRTASAPHHRDPTWPCALVQLTRSLLMLTVQRYDDSRNRGSQQWALLIDAFASAQFEFEANATEPTR